MELKENQAVLILERTEDGGMLISVDSGNLNDTLESKICTVIGEKFADDQDFQEQILSCIDSDDEEIQEIRKKPFLVREFPIFHHFLVTLFQREQLAIRLKYKDLFRRIGEYEVESFCDCDCYWCGDIVLKRDITLEKSELIAFHYPDCVISLTFDPDGTIDMVNLSGLPYQFPFFLEVRDVMDGRVITYEKEHAQMVVDNFFKDVPFLHKTGDVFSTMDYQVVANDFGENIVVWDEII